VANESNVLVFSFSIVYDMGALVSREIYVACFYLLFSNRKFAVTANKIIHCILSVSN